MQERAHHTSSQGDLSLSLQMKNSFPSKLRGNFRGKMSCCCCCCLPLHGMLTACHTTTTTIHLGLATSMCMRVRVKDGKLLTNVFRWLASKTYFNFLSLSSYIAAIAV